MAHGLEEQYRIERYTAQVWMEARRDIDSETQSRRRRGVAVNVDVKVEVEAEVGGGWSTRSEEVFSNKVRLAGSGSQLAVCCSLPPPGLAGLRRDGTASSSGDWDWHWEWRWHWDLTGLDLTGLGQWLQRRVQYVVRGTDVCTPVGGRRSYATRMGMDVPPDLGNAVYTDTAWDGDLHGRCHEFGIFLSHPPRGSYGTLLGKRRMKKPHRETEHQRMAEEENIEAPPSESPLLLQSLLLPTF